LLVDRGDVPSNPDDMRRLEAIACEETGRPARVVVLDPKYCDTIILRWQEFSGGTAARDGDARGYEEIAGSREAA
jgi:hypothetical protein